MSPVLHVTFLLQALPNGIHQVQAEGFLALFVRSSLPSFRTTFEVNPLQLGPSAAHSLRETLSSQ